MNLDYGSMRKTEHLEKLFSFLKIQDFCKISLVSKEWYACLQTNTAWENSDYFLLPERIRNISWLSSKEKHRQNLNEFNEIMSFALQDKDTYCEGTLNEIITIALENKDMYCQETASNFLT